MHLLVQRAEPPHVVDLLVVLLLQLAGVQAAGRARRGADQRGGRGQGGGRAVLHIQGHALGGLCLVCAGW